MSRNRGALARSKSIDHQLDEDRERRQKEIQLLILGGAGSGKSTFIKQLRIHHGDGFPEDERARLRPFVYENISEAINLVIDNMKKLNIPFQSEKNETFAAQFKEEFPRKIPIYKLLAMEKEKEKQNGEDAAMGKNPSPTPKDRNMPDYMKILDHAHDLKELVRDTGFNKVFTERVPVDGQKITQAEDFFLSDLGRILSIRYVPTIQDVLYIRKPTLGVQEHSFSVNGLSYRVIDVAGQKSQRKKWIHFFEGVTAVIFFASLDGFDEKLEEDKSLNSLQDSMETFQEVAANEFLSNTDFILFLNKEDLFKEKIKTKNIAGCFPDYKGENSVEETIKYIKEQFTSRKPPGKQMYMHISCAIDTATMKTLVDSVLEIIVELNLKKAAPF